MVASRHPSSRSADVPSADRRIGLRPVSGRSPSASAAGGCREQRPQLRLVVDNTACASRGRTVTTVQQTRRAGSSEAGDDERVAIAVELVAWLRASAQLVEARWRLAHQRWINRYGHLGLTGRLVGLGPIVGLAAVVVFGGLFGLRVAQESSSGPLGDPTRGPGSVAAVATSTVGPADASMLATPAVPGSAVVVVHPGDSLWSIAVNRYPDHDPRAVVDAFVEMNGPSMIRSGQQLVVPPSLLEN